MAHPREEDLQGIYIALLLFATLIIALRFYARSMRSLQWSKPDIAIIVAWVGCMHEIPPPPPFPPLFLRKTPGLAGFPRAREADSVRRRHM